MNMGHLVLLRGHCAIADLGDSTAHNPPTTAMAVVDWLALNRNGALLLVQHACNHGAPSMCNGHPAWGSLQSILYSRYALGVMQCIFLLCTRKLPCTCGTY